MSLSVFLMLLALQGISGGVSGYTTNKYAVNMLFKEYTPFKLGGVIKKKKEKFIDEISGLVERDIINSNTLREAVSKKEIVDQIEQITKTFLQDSLKKQFGSRKISEIDGFFESTIKNKDFMNENLNKFLPLVLDNILENLNLSNILSQNQIERIIDEVHKLLTEEFEKNDILERYICDLYNENSGVTLSQIFKEEFKFKLVKNITEIIINIIKEDIFKDEEECREVLNKACSSINLDVTLTKLQGLIGEYKISEFITGKEEEQLSLEIFTKVNEFINSQKGRESIGNLIDEIISIGRNSEFTIYEVLPNEMEDSLTNFIQTIVPKVMPYISEWIGSNKSSLDELIESAIDEAIGNIDGSIKQVILSKVRSAFMDDISDKNNIVSKITDYVNKNVNDESYNKLANSIIDYLRTKKINDILELLEKQNLLDSRKLTEFIIKQFKLHGNKVLGMIIKSQFSKRVNEFVKLDLVKLFNEKLKSILFNSILVNKDKVINKLEEGIFLLITKKSNEIFNKNLAHLIDENQLTGISKGFSKLVNKFIKNSSNTYKKQVQELLSSEINNINLKEVVQSHKTEILNTISQSLNKMYDRTLDKYKDYELKEVINLIPNKDELASKISKESHERLISALPSLLDGKIKKFVYGNLEKYNEDEICTLAQNFMGNQLKPLSVFGGVLGIIVGLIYGAATYDSMNIVGTSNGIVNILMSCGIMAGVGVITNVIALWMIFHPYKKVKVLSKIPFLREFALGYIPAHKNEFAMGMARLIDEELLEKKAINKTFNSNKHRIQLSLMEVVSNNNYQIIVNFIREKKQDLNKGIYNLISKYCNNSAFLKKIALSIGNNKFDNIIKKSSVLNLEDKVTQFLKREYIETRLVNLVNNKINSNYQVKDMLSDELSSSLGNYIENQITMIIKNRAENLKKSNLLENIIANNSEIYNSTIKKSCREIFDDEFLINTKNSIKVYIENFIFNDSKKYIDNFMKKFLEDKLDGNNTIGSIFNGKVKDIIDGNLLTLTNWSTDKLIAYLKENEYKISYSVKETISNELNFFEKLAYSAFGGDKIVEDVVSIILNNKLPIMIKEESDKISNLIKVSLDNTVYPMETRTLTIKADEINTGLLFDNMFEQFSDSSIFRSKINNSSDLMLDYFINSPIINYVEMCNMHTLELVHKKFYNEISLVQEDIYNNINKVFNEDNNIISEFINDKFLTALLNKTGKDLFNGIEYCEIEDIARDIFKLITSSVNTQKCIGILIEEFYDNKLSKKELKEFINIDILSKDIENSINIMFEQDKFNNENLQVIKEIIEEALNNHLNLISNDSKCYLVNEIIEAAIESTNHYILPMMQSINLKGITNKQINLMNPEEIHTLFKKVIGEFFMKLYLYGIMGGVFGINLWLTIVLCGADYIYSKKVPRDQDCVED
ncbi:DUF445 family protein [Clostridium saccharobutylicum]|nr:DUF445 family protein [Clostridium saccharobutylicum]